MTDPRETRTYVKSTRSGGSGGNCFECALLPNKVHVRDSKDPTGPELVFDGSQWTRFMTSIKDGAFDLRS